MTACRLLSAFPRKRTLSQSVRMSAISIYIAGCAVISMVAAAFMPDYTGRDISKEYDA